MFWKKIGKDQGKCPCLIPASVALLYDIIKIRLYHRRFPKDVLTLIIIDNNLCRNLVSSLEFPIKFDGVFKVNSITCFIPDFN